MSELAQLLNLVDTWPKAFAFVGLLVAIVIVVWILFG